MNKELRDLFKKEKENIQSKKQERSITISERKIIKKEQDAIKMVDAIPGNTINLTKVIVEKLFDRYIRDKENDLSPKPDKHKNNIIIPVTKVADAMKNTGGKLPIEVKRAIELYNKKPLDNLYYYNNYNNGNTDELAILDIEFFKKQGIKITYDCDGNNGYLIISYTDRILKNFIDYVLNNELFELGNDKKFVDELKSNIDELNKEIETLKMFFSKVKKSNKVLMLEICKDIIKSYKDLPYLNNDKTICISYDVSKLPDYSERIFNLGIDNFLCILEKYNYFYDTLMFHTSTGKKLFIYQPYLTKPLKEIGCISALYSSKEAKYTLEIDINKFEKVALGTDTKATRKK